MVATTAAFVLSLALLDASMGLGTIFADKTAQTKISKNIFIHPCE
jgi:hypothetical protein